MNYDIQRFGDNDTITSSSELKLDYLFADGDNRMTTLTNPRNDLTASDVAQVSATLLQTQAFVGDKYGGAFVTIRSAQIVQTQKVYLDIS